MASTRQKMTIVGLLGRAPKQYSTCSAVSKHKIVIISKTKGVLSKSSSDLGLGRRPIAISDEFLDSTPPSYRVEISMFHFQTFSENAILFGSATLRGGIPRTCMRSRCWALLIRVAP